ncbi:MAG: hypothetical protein NTY76_00900 [Candidatus Omnitrophica bacterium]|nr:hypothetical protein [Candidatus Omnitrophota bacterium]
MKKPVVFISQILLALIFLVIAVLLLNRQHLKNPASPAVYGSPYRGGHGQGYASNEYTGRIDGSDAKH